MSIRASRFANDLSRSESSFSRLRKLVLALRDAARPRFVTLLGVALPSRELLVCFRDLLLALRHCGESLLGALGQRLLRLLDRVLPGANRARALLRLGLLGRDRGLWSWESRLRSASSSRRSFVIRRSRSRSSVSIVAIRASRSPSMVAWRETSDSSVSRRLRSALDLLGESRPSPRSRPRSLHQFGANSFELSLELVELALVDGGRCGFGRRRRRRGVEVEPNERSIHLRPVELRRDRSLTLTATLKLCTQAGAEAPLGLSDLVLVFLVG